MGKQSADPKKLRKLLERCLKNGCGLNMFLPNREFRNPTWDEVENYSTEAYAMALRDVMSAMDGNSEPLLAALEGERLFIMEGDRELLLEKLKDLVKNSPDGVEGEEDESEDETPPPLDR
jgi:hypothetical protein